MSTVMKTSALLALMGSTSLGAHATDVCEQTVDVNVAAGISTELGLLFSTGSGALKTFSNMQVFMGWQGDSPIEVDDDEPPLQSTLYNSVQNNVVTNQMVGYGDNSFVGYDAKTAELFYRDDKDQIFKDKDGKRLVRVYSYEGNGNSNAFKRNVTMDPMTEDWYTSAVSACPANLANEYICKVYWSDWSIDMDKLKMTPSLAIPSQNKGSPMGVTAITYSSDDIAPILAGAVKGSSSNEVAYLMDRSGYLIATSNNTVPIIDGSDNRVKAEHCLDTSISTSSNYLMRNGYLSDQTLAYYNAGEKYVTVKNFNLNNMRFFIVVVADAIEDSKNCEYELEANTLSIVSDAITQLVNKPQNVAKMITQNVIIRNNFTAPTVLNYEDGTQDHLWSVYSGLHDKKTDSFVGYEDNTILAYWEGTLNFRGAGAGPQNMSNYPFNENGQASVDAVSRSLYDTVNRPWYKDTKAAKKKMFSAPYVFVQDGTLGLTYGVPIMQSEYMVGIVGADFFVREIDELLGEFNKNGHGVFIFEGSTSSEYKMIATSCHAKVVDASMSQIKAQDVDDFYISKISKYMEDKNFKDDGKYLYDNEIPFSVLNYKNSNLEWRVVVYSSMYDNPSPYVHPDEAKEKNAVGDEQDDDDMDMVNAFAVTATALVVAVVGVGVSIGILARINK